MKICPELRKCNNEEPMKSKSVIANLIYGYSLNIFSYTQTDYDASLP